MRYKITKQLKIGSTDLNIEVEIDEPDISKVNIAEVKNMVEYVLFLEPVEQRNLKSVK